MKRKILFAYRYGVLGGVSMQLLNRYAEFSREFDIRVLFEENAGVTSSFPDGIATALVDASDRVRYMKSFAPDLTVIIDSPAMIADWQKAGRVGPAVLEVHTTTANIAYLSRLDVGDGISGIITVSEYMRRVVGETAIGSALPVQVVSNCLDEMWFQSLDEPDKQSVVPVIWVGKLDGHKRVLTALNILERLVLALDGEVEVAPVLIGGYAAGSDRIRHVLKTIANRPGLRVRTEWLPRVEYSMMPAILRSAGRMGGISLSTSRNESFGMSVAEALVSGCRVVAPNVGALPEIVPNVMLYPDGDQEAVVPLADAMLRDPTLHGAACAAAAADLRSQMTPASTLRQFREALDVFKLST